MTYQASHFTTTFGKPFADAMVIPGESKADFNNLFNTNLRAFQPEKFTDACTIQALTVCEWRQIRTWATADHILNEIANAPDPDAKTTEKAKFLDYLLTEEKRLSDQHNRLLKQAAQIVPQTAASETHSS